jgi:Holliday junction DNA helicase RuvA
MIAYLRGSLALKDEDSIVLDVGGVGYHVFVTAALLAGLEEGAEIELHISPDIREDAFNLFGFEDVTDRTVFQLLKSVNGVGAKTALAALSGLGAEGVCVAVRAGDSVALKSVKGVGKRIAERIVVDLRGRVDGVGATQFQPTAHTTRRSQDDKLALVLARLGYRRTEIDLALQGLASLDLADAPLDERVRRSLELLSGGRK